MHIEELDQILIDSQSKDDSGQMSPFVWAVNFAPYLDCVIFKIISINLKNNTCIVGDEIHNLHFKETNNKKLVGFIWK